MPGRGAVEGAAAAAAPPRVSGRPSATSCTPAAAASRVRYSTAAHAGGSSDSSSKSMAAVLHLLHPRWGPCWTLPAQASCARSARWALEARHRPPSQSFLHAGEPHLAPRRPPCCCLLRLLFEPAAAAAGAGADNAGVACMLVWPNLLLQPRHDLLQLEPAVLLTAMRVLGPPLGSVCRRGSLQWIWKTQEKKQRQKLAATRLLVSVGLPEPWKGVSVYSLSHHPRVLLRFCCAGQLRAQRMPPKKKKPEVLPKGQQTLQAFLGRRAAAGNAAASGGPQTQQQARSTATALPAAAANTRPAAHPELLLLNGEAQRVEDTALRRRARSAAVPGTAWTADGLLRLHAGRWLLSRPPMCCTPRRAHERGPQTQWSEERRQQLAERGPSK